MIDADYTSMHQISGNTGGLRSDWVPNPSTTIYYTNTTRDTLRSFKIFIVPGLDAIDLKCGIGQSSGVTAYFTARLGEPTIAVPSSSATETDGFDLNSLFNAQCFGRNSGGYLTIARDSGGDLPHTGLWLYVTMIILTNLIDTTSTNTVNQSEYADWYNNDAVWDSKGDPIQSADPDPAPQVDYSYTSLHQPNGLKNDWEPGSTRYGVDSETEAPDKVRMFIPPGSYRCYVNNFVSGDAQVTFVARLNTPPTIAPPAFSTSLRSTGFKISELLAGNCQGRNIAGYMKVVDSVYTPFLDEGYWLYVYCRFYAGASLHFIGDVFISVSASYSDWYSTTLWDAYDDPIPGGLPVPPPGPPPPDPDPPPGPQTTKHLQVGKYILVRGGVAVIENADIGALWTQPTPSSIGLTYDSTHEWNVGDPETTRTIKVEVLDQYGNALRISGLIKLELKFGSGTIYSADTGWSASLVSQSVTNASYYTFTYKRNQAATEHSPVFLATIMITVQLMRSFNITLLDVGGEPIY